VRWEISKKKEKSKLWNAFTGDQKKTQGGEGFPMGGRKGRTTNKRGKKAQPEKGRTIRLHEMAGEGRRAD